MGQRTLFILGSWKLVAGPSYPMGPGPGPPSLRGPPNSSCVIFISWNNL